MIHHTAHSITDLTISRTCDLTTLRTQRNILSKATVGFYQDQEMNARAYRLASLNLDACVSFNERSVQKTVSAIALVLILMRKRQ